MENVIRWADEMNCAVTVCNTDGVIFYMNEKAKKTFAKYGDLIGSNLKDCHKTERALKTIDELLLTGGTNIYTIDKQGIKKIIYQTAWFKDGVVAGLVEISMEIPTEMPHYVRG